MIKILILSSLVLIAFVQSGCATGKKSGRTPMSFEQLDSNGNGLINRDEFVNRRANRRGSNQSTKRQRSMEKMFNRFDNDGNGMITYEEYNDMLERMQSLKESRPKGDGMKGKHLW